MSTFREMVRVQLDELKKSNRTSLLADTFVLHVLVSSFVVAALHGEKTQARELLARLVALGSLLAEHADLIEPATAVASTKTSDEPTWTLDTWESQLAAIDAKTTPEEVGRSWLRHRHLFDNREGRPSYEKAWRDLRTKLDAAKINPNDVKAWLNDQDEKRGSR